MKWTITDTDRTRKDSTGMEGFVIRMEEELRQEGPPLEGFRFLNSPMEMLRFTREIEDEVLSAPKNANLYVGFQTAQKLNGEARRYRRIVSAGVRVVGFGVDMPKEHPTELVDQWVSLAHNTRNLENQWFLVSSHPTPIAFVGWETSEEMFGKGGLSTPGKEFKGFVSSDHRVVDAMIAYFERLRLGNLRKKVSIQQLGQEVTFPVRRVLTLTDREPKPEIREMRNAAAQLATVHSSEVILYDLSAASYLVTAYPEEKREEWFRVLGKEDVIFLGRGFLAEQLEELESKGIRTGIILPDQPGFIHLSEWASKESIDLIMMPGSLIRPGLLDRLKGFSLKTLLENTDIPVVVYESEDSVWLANDGSVNSGRVALEKTVSTIVW